MVNLIKWWELKNQLIVKTNKLVLAVTVKPRFTAQFGGTEKGVINRDEQQIGVSTIGIAWLLIERKLHSISACDMTLINTQIGRIHDLMSAVSLHDAGIQSESLTSLGSRVHTQFLDELGESFEMR